jgi:hypothetical protein
MKSVDFWVVTMSAWCYNMEDYTRHSHCCEKIESNSSEYVAHFMDKNVIVIVIINYNCNVDQKM